MQIENEKTVEALLREVGWSETRDVDITAWKTELEKQGYVLSESYLKFLRSYGGLKFGGTLDDIFLDPEEAMTPSARLILRDHGELLGILLYPVGSFWLIQQFLAIDDEWRMYLFLDGELMMVTSKFPHCLMDLENREKLVIVVDYDQQKGEYYKTDAFPG